MGRGHKKDFRGFIERVPRFESTVCVIAVVRSETSASLLGARLYGKEKQFSPAVAA